MWCVWEGAARQRFDSQSVKTMAADGARYEPGHQKTTRGRNMNAADCWGRGPTGRRVTASRTGSQTVTKIGRGHGREPNAEVNRINCDVYMSMCCQTRDQRHLARVVVRRLQRFYGSGSNSIKYIAWSQISSNYTTEQL